MPILPHYQSTAQPADYQVKKQLILFLQQSSDGQYEFVCDGTYERLSHKAK
jgi:hypothetical protein